MKNQRDNVLYMMRAILSSQQYNFNAFNFSNYATVSYVVEHGFGI